MSPLPALTTNITIQGPGVSSLTINGTGSGSSSVLTISAGVTAQIQDLPITGGTITNNGSLTAAGSATIGQINGTGALTVGSIADPAMLQLAIGSGISTQASLTVRTGSTLNITNNQFNINYGAASDPISTIATYLTGGFNNGTWNGLGINSSSAAANPGYALGYADGADGVVAGLSSGTIEIKYTLMGDANLDGIVSGDDFTILAGNLGKSGISAWDKGNFLYSPTGSITGDDFTALVNNLGKQANISAAALPPSNPTTLNTTAPASPVLQTTGSDLSSPHLHTHPIPAPKPPIRKQDKKHT